MSTISQIFVGKTRSKKMVAKGNWRRKMKTNDFYEVDGCMDFIPVKIVGKSEDGVIVTHTNDKRDCKLVVEEVYRLLKPHEPQKPVVPKFVGEWIKDHKGDYNKWDEDAKADFVLWKRCLSTNDNISSIALEEMLKYNLNDVDVTRNLHKGVNGWITGTNIGNIVNHKQPENSTLRCKCGSDDIQPE